VIKSENTKKYNHIRRNVVMTARKRNGIEELCGDKIRRKSKKKKCTESKCISEEKAKAAANEDNQ